MLDTKVDVLAIVNKHSRKTFVKVMQYSGIPLRKLQVAPRLLRVLVVLLVLPGFTVRPALPVPKHQKYTQTHSSPLATAIPQAR